MLQYLAKVFLLTAEIPDLPDDVQIHPTDNEDATRPNSVFSLTKQAAKIQEKEASKPGAVQNSELKDILMELQKITSSMKDKELSESIVDEWKLFAKVLDRLLFWICFIVMSIYFITMAAVISSNA